MWTEEKLDGLLTGPSAALVADMKRIEGDIMVLGAGGKMGPTLCVLAKKAAGADKKIIAVSRFGDEGVARRLAGHGVETISCDLLDRDAADALPDAENIIFMAGRKFGTSGNAGLTWAMNATLPSLVASRFRDSRFTVFSSGNIYPFVGPGSGGCAEDTPPAPVGEYAMSCLARERAFEYAASVWGTRALLLRLNYAVDLRYGVLYDIAEKLVNGGEVSLNVPCFNCVWQGYANEAAIRGLLLAESPAAKLNITGPETLSVRRTAHKLAAHLEVTPRFAGDEGGGCLLSDPSAAMEALGYPSVPADTLIRWQAEWIASGGRSLGKSTHFEESGGKY